VAEQQGGGAVLEIERISPLAFSSFGLARPSQMLYWDFTTYGGVQVRQEVWNCSRNFALCKSTLGTTLVTFARNTTVTLPDASTCKGVRHTVKQQAATGTATVPGNTGQSQQTMDGATTNTWLDTRYKFPVLESVPTGWIVVGRG
jgi:hypothetical protein